ncbi:Pleckstrin homology-like domain [Plasmopara halstedii]|uniref:Pleckstrin homology-like domain n=1 Tax=Plasmopara halstedii TaxID=4781 RepID=A0A0P1ALA5_PLAHL|nr:Pleckstrin homology-like domain [Plasmopara halstedii]CEG41676.1 Pleckstrin homology-like domain [Plasmopara halstedii]|eukprot:XP_024578045.1 Pleckstrin homology-like domain [Plasmopara halstedii]
MEGYLDYLEKTGRRGLRNKIWVRRFFKVNLPFNVLEIFADETQYERRGRLDLRGAVVSTADELGELLNEHKMAAEMSRRFIFRITDSGKKHHYLCSDINGNAIPALTTYKLASMARIYMEKWLYSLRRTIAAGKETLDATIEFGKFNSQIAAFLNKMHISARISDRVCKIGPSMYEITIKAWILERELTNEDENQEIYCSARNQRNFGDLSWQIAEYACSWKVMKSKAELQNFDGKIQQFIGSDMLNCVFPSHAIGKTFHMFHLHASAAQKAVQKNQHIQVYDTYLQSLLLLPELSMFGSDASKLFDNFFDVSPHLVSFRKLEKKSGLSMHLHDRKVVPWINRERFEVVYEMHRQGMAAQKEKAHRCSIGSTAQIDKPVTRHCHNCSPYRKQNNSEAGGFEDLENLGTTLPAPVKLSAATEKQRTRPREAVEDRIARIGHLLIIEAFET